MTAVERIECARVFINFKKKGDESYNFTLKCFLCRCHFKDWTNFVLHVQARHHEYLEQAHHSKQSTTADKEENQDHDAVDVLKEETIEFARSQQSETIEVIDHSDAAVTAEDKWSFDDKEFPPIIDFQVEIMPHNYKPDDIKSEYSEDSNEFEQNEAMADQHSEDTQKEEEHVQLDSANDSDYKEDKSESTTAPAAKRKRRSRAAKAQHTKKLKATEEGENLNEDKSDIESNSNESESDEENGGKQKRETHPRTKTPFFHMRKTPAQTMLTFIEIIRQHPCHWDTQHPDYNCRDAREASAVQISEQVAHRLKINITPQVARTSVLFLCRWYDREYMRTTAAGKAKSKKRTAKRPRPNSHHPKYYAALHAFLPSQHLKVVKCDQCARQFKSESHLLTHKHAVHDAPAPFKCGHCPRSFAHLSTLRLHENRHTKERTWPCELCSYRAVSVADFQTHMTAHTNMRAFVCETCGAAYKSSTSLSVHRRTHEPPRLSCSLCGKMFRENYRLKRHMWEHEADNEDDDDDNNNDDDGGANDDNGPRQSMLSHKCDTCKRRFASVATLQQHRNFVHGINSETTQTTTTTTTTTEIEIVQTTKPNMSRVKTKRARSPSPAADEQDTDYSCTTCEVDFINLKELRAHSLKMHDIVIL